jgi:hypothetical protein
MEPDPELGITFPGLNRGAVFRRTRFRERPARRSDFNRVIWPFKDPKGGEKPLMRNKFRLTTPHFHH